MEQVGVQLMAQGANAFDADMASATKAVAGFGASVNKSATLIQDASGRWRTSSGRFASDAEKAAAGVETVAPAAKKAGDAAVKAGNDAEKGGHGFSAFGQVVVGALREVGKIAVDALGQALKATAGFVKDSIGAAGDFEAGMNKFQVVAGKDVDTKGLEKFHDLFIQLGRELPVSTSEVQQAAIEMVSGGIDPAIVAGGALKQTLQFAAASGLSLADAAQTSAKFLAGWTSSAATTEEKIAFLAMSTDTLTQAAAASSTTAAELRLGLFNVQGAAQALHASFRDTTATLALLAPAFESSAQAGTALNVFMTRLVPQTNKAKDAMAELGLITAKGQNLFFDTKGSFLGMSNAAQVLKDKLGNLTDERKIDLLHQLFGNDAMKVANLLMQDGAKGLEGMIAKMDKANGVQAAAAIVQRGYNTALENAKGSVEALQITIGEALLPVLADLLNTYIAPAINAVTEFATSILKASDPLLAFAQSLTSISPDLSAIAFYLIDLVRHGEDLGGWLATTPALFQTLVGAIQGTVAVFSQLSSAFDTGGISGLISTLVADISAALPTIETALAGWGQALIDWITPYIPPMLDALGAAVDQAWAWVEAQAPGWLAQLELWGEQLGAWIAPYIPVALDALNDLVDQAWGWVKEQAPGWFEELKAWGQQLIAWVAPMIPPALVELGKLGTQLISWVGEQATPLLAELQTWAQSFVAWIPGATVKFLAEWPKMFDQFLGWIGNEAGPLLKKLGDWAVSFVAWVVPMIPGFLVALAGIALAIGTFVIETAAVLNKKIAQWAVAFLGWVATDVLPKLPGILGSIQKSINDWIATAQNALAKEMIKVGAALIQGMKDGISSSWKGMESYINGLAGQLPEWFKAYYHISSPSQLMADLVGSPIGLGIVQGIESTIPALQGTVTTVGTALSGMGAAAAAATSDMTAKISSALKGTTVIKDAKTLGTNAIAGLVSGMESNLRAIDKVAGKVADKVGDAFAGSFDSHSPAGITIPFGASLINGLIVGVQQMLPGLTGLVESLDGQLTAQFSHVSDSVSQQISDMVKDIQDKVKSAQDAFASLVASGFGATASISRQVASNLGAFADSTTAANAKATADALAKAETEARAMVDPDQGAKYFEMRSKQILELASLQKSLATQQTAIADTFTKQQDLAAQADAQRSALAIAASDDERNAILAKIAALNAEASAQVQARAATQSAMQVTQQQLALIGTATDAEIKGFAAQQAASGSSVSDAAAQLREILNANLTVKGKTASLPGIDDPTIRTLNSLLDKLTSPAASPTQIASSAQYINNTTSNSYNLGIQTNNSPQVLQQSYAVMAASAP